MKETYHFKHLTDARQRQEIAHLIYEHGYTGYGVYWALIELACRNGFTLYSDLKRVSKELRCSKILIHSVLNDFDLFLYNHESDRYEPKMVGFEWSKTKLWALNGERKRLFNVNVNEWYSLIKMVFERDSYTCTYCGSVGGKLEADHIIPFSAGGSDDIENLTTACRRCNRQKKDKSVYEFKQWRAARNG